MRIWTAKRKKRARKATSAGRRLLAAAMLLLACGSGLMAEKKPKAAEYGLVVGTVFRENGFAFGGVEVKLEADPEPGFTGKKPKGQKTVSSPRGEFSFRVAPKPMRYTLSVKAPGYQPMSKSAAIQADERVDVTFLLEVEKK